MLCAQHALNNLLQQPCFTPQDLASIAQALDREEANELYGGELNARMKGDSEQNFDDTGFFSLAGQSRFRRRT